MVVQPNHILKRVNAELFFLSITAVPIILSIFLALFNIRRNRFLAAFLAGGIFIPAYLAIAQYVYEKQFEDCLRQICTVAVANPVAAYCINWADAGIVYPLVLLGDIKIFLLGGYVIWRVHRRLARQAGSNHSMVYSTE